MRKSRQLQLADTGLYHKFFKGHNGERILATPEQKKQYLQCLFKTKDNPKIKTHVHFYGFCIMSNHPHEVGRAGWKNSIKNSRQKGIAALGNWMRNAHSLYGRWFNDTNGRYGKVSNERAKTTQIKSEADVLEAMLYADANPVRAKIVTHPSRYKWSSYRFYAYGETNEFTQLLDVPPAYDSLGKTPKQRQKAYRSLMDAYLRRNGLWNDAPDEDVIDLSMCGSNYDCIMTLFNDVANRSGPV